MKKPAVYIKHTHPIYFLIFVWGAQRILATKNLNEIRRKFSEKYTKKLTLLFARLTVCSLLFSHFHPSSRLTQSILAKCGY